MPSAPLNCPSTTTSGRAGKRGPCRRAAATHGKTQGVKRKRANAARNAFNVEIAHLSRCSNRPRLPPQPPLPPEEEERQPRGDADQQRAERADPETFHAEPPPLG